MFDHHVVDTRTVDAVRSDLQLLSLIDRRLPGDCFREGGGEIGRRDAREERETAGVDPENRYLFGTELPNSLEVRPVAAERDAEIFGAWLVDRVDIVADVDRVDRNASRSYPLFDSREFLVAVGTDEDDELLRGGESSSNHGYFTLSTVGKQRVMRCSMWVDSSNHSKRVISYKRLEKPQDRLRNYLFV